MGLRVSLFSTFYFTQNSNNNDSTDALAVNSLVNKGEGGGGKQTTDIKTTVRRRRGSLKLQSDNDNNNNKRKMKSNNNTGGGGVANICKIFSAIRRQDAAAVCGSDGESCLTNSNEKINSNASSCGSRKSNGGESGGSFASSINRELKKDSNNAETLSETEKLLLFKIFNEKRNQFKSSIFTLIDYYYKKFNFTNGIGTYQDVEIESSDKELFSDTEIRVLKLAWTSVKKDIEKVGMLMFMRSFESTPELQSAFSAFRDMNKEDLIKSYVLRSHSQKVISIVENVIKNIDNKENNLVQMLQALGRNHNIYGANDQFLYIMEKQFVDSIKPHVVKFVLNSGVDSNLNDIQFIDNQQQQTEEPGCCSEEEAAAAAILIKEDHDMKIAYIQNLWRKVFSFIKKNMSIGINERKRQ